MRVAGLLMLALLNASAAAEVIRIPLGAQGSEAIAVQLPARGTPAGEVLARLGEPERRNEPVGDPPIGRWDYPDFSVYFENDRVLHCVLRHRPAHPVN